MPVFHIDHKLTDFDAWLSVFKDNPQRKEREVKYGLTTRRVIQDAGGQRCSEASPHPEVARAAPAGGEVMEEAKQYADLKRAAGDLRVTVPAGRADEGGRARRLRLSDEVERYRDV